MNASMLDEAKAELKKAIAYYDDQRLGLGDDFADEVRQTVERINSTAQ